MRILIALLFFAAMLNAQQLVPYQVQDAKAWKVRALWGYKDLNFNVVLSPINEEPNLFKNGYCVLVKNGKMGLMDTEGKIILPPIYDKCSDIVGDWVEVKEAFGATSFFEKSKEKPSYFLNIKTKKTLELNNNILVNGIAQLSNVPDLFMYSNYDEKHKGNYYGLTNSAGEIKLKTEYKYIDRGSDENDVLIIKTTDDLYGFVNQKGDWIVQPQYEYMSRFEDGIALVERNNKWGYINKLGQEILPIQYDGAHDFKNSYADATIGNEVFIIDKSGKALFKSPNINYLVYAKENIFIVKNKNDSMYILDKNGRNQALGADKIVTFDDENFIILIRKSAYAFYKNTITRIPLENVVYVRAFKMGVYVIDCKSDSDKKENTTIFDNFGNSVASKDSTFSYREHEDLQLLEMGWDVITPVPNWENDVRHFVYSYVTSKGKKYSDITP